MHMTFDGKVPLPEQRLRVAMSKSVRNHGKRHAVTKRRKKLSAAKKQRERHHLAVISAKRARAMVRARAYWSGASDELK